MKFLTQGNWGHQRIKESKGLGRTVKAQGRRVKPGGISEKLVKLNENGWPKLEAALKSDMQGVQSQRSENR